MKTSEIIGYVFGVLFGAGYVTAAIVIFIANLRHKRAKKIERDNSARKCEIFAKLIEMADEANRSGQIENARRFRHLAHRYVPSGITAVFPEKT